MLLAGGSGPEHDDCVPLGEDPDNRQLLAIGNAEAKFTELYRALRAQVRSYLQRAVDVQDADDLTSDVFATVWLRWAAFPVEAEKRRAWVFGIARNKVRETIRSQRYGRGLLRQLVARDASVPAPSVEKEVIALQRVRGLLARLPRSESEALELVAFSDLSCAEAADALHCSVSAVTSRVSRGRRRLRDMLAAEEGDA